MNRLSSKLISFIIANNLSFNIINSEEFQELLDTIKSHYYKLPCRQTLRYMMLPEMFLILPEVEKEEKKISKSKNLKKFSFKKNFFSSLKNVKMISNRTLKCCNFNHLNHHNRS
ncbi:hypothetical protein BpHYR1_021262 [Brachionus plicatilis]|uniref:Uncharacterized protein n=1 Tax=Brachionus plicatilis TaxID=10195 RepID=A0A3M7SCN5_BRAPC|nr:hypothetical protein BpHYR1_021262 [Brachionus plicatilis]